MKPLRAGVVRGVVLDWAIDWGPPWWTKVMCVWSVSRLRNFKGQWGQGLDGILLEDWRRDEETVKKEGC